MGNEIDEMVWQRVVKMIKDLPDDPVERAQGALSGKSIKRFYTDDFIGNHKDIIRGVVGEMEDRRYTRSYGVSERIEQSYVVDKYDKFGSKEQYGLNMDLETGEGIKNDFFDTFICTHTLTYISNPPKAIRNIVKILRPGGGTALMTFAGMLHRASAQELDLYKPYYGILPHIIPKVLKEFENEVTYQITTYGHIKTATATLYGIPSEYFSEQELMAKDDDYPLIVAVVIKRKRNEL